MESAKGTSSSKRTSTKKSTNRRRANTTGNRFVVCIKSGGNVDLEPMKVYVVLPDRMAKSDGLLRVVDDSCEDYLYPSDYFRPIRVPKGLLSIVERKES